MPEGRPDAATVPAGAVRGLPPTRLPPRSAGLLWPGPAVLAIGVVRPASRPRTPAWLPRASTLPLRMAGLPSLRLTLPPERLGALKEPLRGDELRSKLDELRLELLPTVERLGLDERLELLLKLLRLELELDERLELLLKELRLLELLLDERLLLMELLWLPPPPPRLPPLRCAKAGVALSARATIASAITFEVFISLLLSLFIVFSILLSLPYSHIPTFIVIVIVIVTITFSRSFSAAKIQPFPEGNS